MSAGREHRYEVRLQWTGNRGQGTRHYRSYSRDHEISAPHKSVLPGSSDPAFRGDASRYNPEELLVASLSACHMLWYLHLCSEEEIVVVEYTDDATGAMVLTEDGGGSFTSATLRPCVTVEAGSDAEGAAALHERAHELCFIASSVNFPVVCEPTVRIAGEMASGDSAP